MHRYTGIPDGCPTGQYYDPANGCKSCSKPANQYQEVLCPCESARDSVIGCKSRSDGANLCPSRSAALEQCTRRYGTPSLALGTTASTISTSMSSYLSAYSTSFVPESTDFTESTRLNSMLYTTQHLINNPQSISSDGHLQLIFGIVAAVVVLFIIGAVAVYIKLRRRCRPQTFDEHEEMEAFRTSRDEDAAYNSANVDVAETLQSPLETSSTPAGNLSRPDDEQLVSATGSDAFGDGNSGEEEPRRSSLTYSDPIDAAAPPRTSDAGSSNRIEGPTGLFHREDKQHSPVHNSCSFLSDYHSRTVAASATTESAGDAINCVGHVPMVNPSAEASTTTEPAGDAINCVGHVPMDNPSAEECRTPSP